MARSISDVLHARVTRRRHIKQSALSVGALAGSLVLQACSTAPTPPSPAPTIAPAPTPTSPPQSSATGVPSGPAPATSAAKPSTAAQATGRTLTWGVSLDISRLD